MADNPYVNKVIYGDTTIIDITDTTAESSDVLSGKSFYNASGAKTAGSLTIPVTSVNNETGDVVLDASDVGAIAVPSSASSGDVLTYDGTAWGAAAAPSGLPTVTSSDNGKVLKVSSGSWTTAFDGMFIASYGSTTYADILTAYQNNKVVYCRASSNSNPGTGNQLRMAFLAYVNNQTTPTEFEFQYYRSVSTHSDSTQGDEVYVYKVNSSGTWSVTKRNAYTKIVAGTGLSSSYSNGTLTITNDQTGLPAVTSSDNGKVLRVVNGVWAAAQLPSASGVSF